MPNYTLYSIKLANKKWFLHVSPDSRDNSNILFDCCIMHEFVRQNPPIEITETIQLSCELDIDYFVRKYMRHYGIDNARGGTYTNVVLEESVKRVLENEFKISYGGIVQQSGLLLDVYTEFSSGKHWTRDELCNEIMKQVRRYTKYCNEREELKTVSDNHTITRNILYDLDGLRGRSVHYARKALLQSFNTDGMRRYVRPTVPDIVRYKRVINLMKRIYEIYKNDTHDPYRMPSTVIVEPELYLQQPNVIFDTFFYHNHVSTHLGEQLETAYKILDHYEHIVYCIINRIDELTFDVSCYGENYETKYAYSMQYLIQKLSEISKEN